MEQVHLDSPPSEPSEIAKFRRIVEPWLSAVFQSEHLSLLLGSGFTTAVAGSLGVRAAGMSLGKFGCSFDEVLAKHCRSSAERAGRGEPNIEDQIRSALALLAGLDVLQDKRHAEVEESLNTVLSNFLTSILTTEAQLRDAFDKPDQTSEDARRLLTSFLLSFASRAPSRERLHVFTTNYDRLIEYACDIVGLRPIDRFVGGLSPVFRSSRVEVDMHYNPPGIRGEPRYLEGVIRLSKLHGSLDWRLHGGVLRRANLAFGADINHPDVPKEPLKTVMIYPNPAKDVETQHYPYAELFRDFSTGLCRPNSVLVTYGYGFGDDHVNRVIRDMLTIPSTHLVAIAYSDAGGRVPSFIRGVGRPAQVSYLMGSHFGNLATLVDHYLPKPALDQISHRRSELLQHRGDSTGFGKDGGSLASLGTEHK